MFESSELKLSEMQRYVDMSLPGISKSFKTMKTGVSFSSNRIVGISPEAASSFIGTHSKYKFHAPSITLSASLCGGCGKTTSISSLAAALRRVTSRLTDPIVLIDGDSQGSFTHLIYGTRANDDDKILIDYLEGNAQISDILNNIDNNVYIIKSNLNSAFLDKVINRPSDIKNAMKNLYFDIFNHLGKNTKIFQDHTPQLSNLFASSVCALHQMLPNTLCNILIPIRSDEFSIQGAKYIINEINELKETYSFDDNSINIHCFLSALDRRIASSGEALKRVMNDQILNNYLCPIVIRYCSEIPKSIMASSNIFSSGKKSNATLDYQDLLQYIFNQE